CVFGGDGQLIGGIDYDHRDDFAADSIRPEADLLIHWAGLHRGADTRVCGVETRLDALDLAPDRQQASRRVSTRQAESPRHDGFPNSCSHPLPATNPTASTPPAACSH